QGYMGILEPSASKERLTGLDDMDLIIIPGAAFDASGNRLGYGAGFYDRLLTGMKKIIPVIAPAYEEQIVEKIPSEPHDVKVSKIVTDKRVIECEGK
ncbi:MAG: 5-formyltetrahydrofolate cyclo-ligase, partial [Nitrospirae bacterium]|nr:5-formyltetrahydrofolate cyclo-ligase [Nitrospirota bacterium]